MALIIEYDGTCYYGFQLQVGLPTIQGEIEKALWQLTKENIRVMGAGRTDAGVHAKGQVISFWTESSLEVERFIHGLNFYLPLDIAVKAVYKVNSNFNVRHDARNREYKYYILNSWTRSPIRAGYSYRVGGYLDIGAMNRACEFLVGEHDFISFASSKEAGMMNTIRRVYSAEVKKDNELVIFNIVASAFLPHQVRNTVGSLVRVGLGKMKVEEFCSIISKRKRALAGPTAPAQGLCLMQVNYSQSFGEEM